ncbi:MAG: saccharopine dehydrogenase NADP-binding domain-containing protein [Steroidobacteraceae bacterium]
MNRLVILGAAGNFGARIVRAFAQTPGVEVIAAGRSGRSVADAPQVTVAALNMDSVSLAQELQALQPDVVVHCVGPFQGQDYRVARASLAAGAHYIDLADGRQFVAHFGSALDSQANAAGRMAVSGASTLPALSSAVVDALVRDGLSPEVIEIAIAPGQRAPRGAATLQAVFSYLGRPVQVWEDGKWRQRTGWMDLRRMPLAFGSRWAALCDVPDLTLFPERYSPVRTVRFHAALEFGAQHAALWCLAGLVRMGIALPVDRWCGALERMAGQFDRFGGPWGGMRISVVGKAPSGHRLRRTWQLAVPALSGPEIPCLAAILLARRLLSGERMPLGARACMGLLALEDFSPMFEQWNIRTEIREEV